jgi:RNA polymerase-binding transcription factor DksA
MALSSRHLSVFAGTTNATLKGLSMAVKKAMSAIKAALAGKKAPAAKVPARATVAMAASATKKAAPAKKVVAKPASVKKATPNKKVVAKPVPVKKAAPTKVTATKSAATKSAAKSAAKTATKTATAPVSRSAPRSRAKATATAAPLRTHRAGTSSRSGTSSSGTRPRRLQVRQDETPWTAKELKAVRAELETDIARLQVEISQAEDDLAGLMRDAGEGAGDDQADAGTKTFEREQEISLANNARGMFEQSVHALERIVDGSYGICESCGSPIGKNRLLAFPRATLCMPCKSKQERR